MSLKFVPPKNVSRYAYAVEYDQSQTRFDTFNDLGSCKNSLQHKIRYRDGDFKAAHVLENVEGEWYVLHTIGKNDQHMPWQKDVETGGWRTRYTVKKAVPMTRDEYAEWRLQVEHERIAAGKNVYSYNTSL